MTAGFIIATALNYRLPFTTWTVAQGIKRHIHRDIYGAPWTEDMALRLCIPVYGGPEDPRPANDNEEQTP